MTSAWAISPEMFCLERGRRLSPMVMMASPSALSINFTVDQQPCIYGFCPVIQLAFYCRYGIRPSSMDAGAGIITKENVASVMELSKKNYR